MFKTHWLKSILFACGILFITHSSFAIDSGNAIIELTELLNGITSMQADFVQFSLGKQQQQVEQRKTRGKMYLLRPGKFRWEVLQPARQLIIADGKYAWVYDEDLQQVSKRAIDYHDAGNPAMLLSGSMEALQRSFKINKLEIDDQGVWFELRPRSANNVYQWIKLYFVQDVIVTMIMADNLGQQSEIDFTKVRSNISLANTLFKFTPPAGVDVIDNM